MSKVAILLSTSASINRSLEVKQLLTILQVCKTVFSTVHILTVNGECPDFGISEEENNNNTHKANVALLKDLTVLDYTKIDLVQNEYQGLIVPDGMGHYVLANSLHRHLKALIYSFAKFRKPICMIGSGCATLLATTPEIDEEWMFRHYSLTAPSNMEDVRDNRYGTIPSLEEFILVNFGHYTFSNRDGPHVVIDDHLVTAQKRSGSLVAIQSFILLCNR